jgi:hypothetical protein
MKKHETMKGFKLIEYILLKDNMLCKYAASYMLH